MPDVHAEDFVAHAFDMGAGGVSPGTGPADATVEHGSGRSNRRRD